MATRQECNVGALAAGFPPAPLEDWYRYNYFSNEIDISGSGVEDYTFLDLQNLGGFTLNELNEKKVGDGYTVGEKSVRDFIAELFGTGNPDSVMITNGANEGLHLVMRSLLQAEDELITLGPCYHCHDKIAESIGCVVRKWTLSLEDGSGSLEVGKLDNLITSKTKAICLNFPHNPTGISIGQDLLDEIVELARRNDLYLIWDAVFQELVYEQTALTDPIHQYDKTVTLGTFSKAYGAPGLRFGWAIGPPELIAGSVRQKDYGNLFVAPILEFIAEKMLRNLDKFSAPRLIQARDNRESVARWSLQDDLDVGWRQPDGGVCGLLRLPSGSCDIDFCNKLLRSAGVLLVPGSCFSFPGYARLGFGGNSHLLNEGLDRLGYFLRSDV